jgi:hypothetical protein
MIIIQLIPTLNIDLGCEKPKTGLFRLRVSPLTARSEAYAVCHTR